MFNGYFVLNWTFCCDHLMRLSLNLYCTVLLFRDSKSCVTLLWLFVHLVRKKQMYHNALCGILGMHSKLYKTRSLTAIDRGKYIVWTSEMDNCLTDVLMDQVEMINQL